MVWVTDLVLRPTLREVSIREFVPSGNASLLVICLRKIQTPLPGHLQLRQFAARFHLPPTSARRAILGAHRSAWPGFIVSSALTQDIRFNQNCVEGPFNGVEAVGCSESV